MENDGTVIDDKERLISLPDAAEIYGFNAIYLRTLARKGRLEAQKVGNSWITTPLAMEIYIKSRQVKGRFRKDIQID